MCHKIKYDLHMRPITFIVWYIFAGHHSFDKGVLHCNEMAKDDLILSINMSKHILLCLMNANAEWQEVFSFSPPPQSTVKSRTASLQRDKSLKLKVIFWNGSRSFEFVIYFYLVNTCLRRARKSIDTKKSSLWHPSTVCFVCVLRKKILPNYNFIYRFSGAENSRGKCQDKPHHIAHFLMRINQRLLSKLKYFFSISPSHFLSFWINNKWLELSKPTPVIMTQTHRIFQRILKNFITIVTDFSKKKREKKSSKMKRICG